MGICVLALSESASLRHLSLFTFTYLRVMFIEELLRSESIEIKIFIYKNE